jgi:hypothetical protein
VKLISSRCPSKKRISRLIAIVGFLVPTFFAQADTVVGLVGTEPGTPIAGEEDVIVYDNTGSIFGCSTPNGTPIWTPVIFDDVVLTINGSIPLDLGNIDPGFAETATYPDGVFIDGSIKSLSLTFSLSTTDVTTDLNQTYDLAPSVSLSGLPVNGSIALIEASPNIVVTPEPDPLPVFLVVQIVFVFAALSKTRVKG